MGGTAFSTALFKMGGIAQWKELLDCPTVRLPLFISVSECMNESGCHSGLKPQTVYTNISKPVVEYHAPS